MSIIQKIDSRIKRFEKQIIIDRKRIDSELIKSPSDYTIINTLLIDIERLEVSIRQLEWVLKNI